MALTSSMGACKQLGHRVRCRAKALPGEDHSFSSESPGRHVPDGRELGVYRGSSTKRSAQGLSSLKRHPYDSFLGGSGQCLPFLVKALCGVTEGPQDAGPKT